MLKAGWNLGTNCSRSFSLLTLTFSWKPFPTGISGDTTNLWHKMTTCLAYTLHFNTRGCLFPLPLCNISHFQNGEGQPGGGRGINTKVSASPSPSRRGVSRKWCGRRHAINSHENHRLAGRLPSPPPPPRHPQTITGHPGSSPRCCCLWKLQAVA